jgi:hypothetical protein
MAEKRLSGAKNYLYFGDLGAEVTTGLLSGDKFFKITAKAATGSALPATSVVGDVFRNKPAITLVAGDKVKPFTLTKLGFVTNVPQSASKEKFEDTVQSDDAKSFTESDKPEISGNIDGYFVAEASKIADILGRFFVIVSDNGAGVITYAGVTTGVFHFFLGRNETTAVGEIEIMQYMPSLVDSLTVDKPMEGKQLFNFNYSVVGSERPNLYNRTITA